MKPHVHGKSCEGVALVQFVDEAGAKRSWAFSVSLCPLRPDSEESARAHAVQHLTPGSRIVKIDLLSRSSY